MMNIQIQNYQFFIIQGEMHGRMIEKINKDVNLERKGNRNRRFQQSRKNLQHGQEMVQEKEKEIEELDYLKNYQGTLRQYILSSLSIQIPCPLPPLTVSTISFYRRDNQPIFQTRITGKKQIDFHMAYQSLTILAKVEEKNYANYKALVKEFERDLSLYLGMPSKDIREMATIAAGNKILGREKDILNLVHNSPQDLWVLVNHVYENKISCKHLFPYVIGKHELAFKALYQLSNNKGDESIAALIDSDQIIQSLLKALQQSNAEIQRHAIRIIGNIIGDSQEYLQIFQKYGLMNHFFKLLMSSDQSTLKDTCWLISNFTCGISSATAVLQNEQVVTKLMDLLYDNTGLDIKKQVLHIFNYIAHYAEKPRAFQFLVSQQLLNLCQGYLCLQDTELNIITLHLLHQMLQLGDLFPNEEEENVVTLLIGGNRDLYNDINGKSQSQNYQMSGVGLDIMSYFSQQGQL